MREKSKPLSKIADERLKRLIIEISNAGRICLRVRSRNKDAQLVAKPRSQKDRYFGTTCRFFVGRYFGAVAGKIKI